MKFGTLQQNNKISTTEQYKKVFKKLKTANRA